jgi:hypothetical protein
MSDPGLTRRLRQQSHRSGLAIGLSMALAIAVCFGGFTWIYVQLDPWVRDFAGAEVAPPTPTPREEASGEEEQAEDEAPVEEEDTPTPEPEEDQQPGEDEDQGNIDPVEEDQGGDNGGFEPDYQVITLEPVNMRSGPGRSFDIIVPLDPGTPLEFTGSREPAPDAADSGLDWLEFETQDGATGWIRSIDVGET